MALPGRILLAREGWVHCLLALLLAVMIHWLSGPWMAAPFWLILVFVVQFFRDPHRDIPDIENGVIAPADGKVVFLGEVEDPFLSRKAFKISIFMNVFSVHANRAPVGGRVKEIWYHSGKFFNAVLDKASKENERNAVWVEDENGRDVVFVQIAGLIARRILCYSSVGDQLRAGDRYGFIRFGSRVDLYLPFGAQAEVSLGDTVYSGSDIIALLPQSI